MLSLYKLIILYMIEAAGGPLSAQQLSAFLIEGNYTDYFSFQHALSDLDQDGLLSAESTLHRTLYSATPEGKNALFFYSDRISEEIKEEIADYLSKNEIAINTSRSVLADIVPSSDGTYRARFQLREDNAILFDVSIKCFTKQEAETACRRWKEDYADIYMSFLEQVR